MLLQKGSKRKDGGNAVAAGQPVQKKLKFGESKAADVKPQEEEEDESPPKQRRPQSRLSTSSTRTTRITSLT
jgi:hypothetical protein